MINGSLEIDILNSFWSLASDDRDVSIQDIVDDLHANGVTRAYTTIKTVMDRLTAKSILVRYKSGKKFFYKATMSKSEMAADTLRTVSNQFFGGSFSNMIRFIERECGEYVS